MAKARANFKIFGEVQGVAFRWFIEERANKLGLTGWVRNCLDGCVEVLVEGEKEKIKELMEECFKGPRFAQVSDIKVNWDDYKEEFKDFRIIF